MCSGNPESGKKGDEVVDDEESSVSFLENLKKEQQHQMLIIKIAALFHLNSLGDSVPSLCWACQGTTVAMHTPSWIWCPPLSSSLLVYLRMRVFTLNTKHSVRQLECPHQASLAAWWCKMAANQEQEPYWTVDIHLSVSIYALLLKYLFMCSTCVYVRMYVYIYL